MKYNSNSLLKSRRPNSHWDLGPHRLSDNWDPKHRGNVLKPAPRATISRRKNLSKWLSWIYLGQQ